MTEFVISADPERREAALEHGWRFIMQLDPKQAWRIKAEPYKPRRSNQQNRYLWGVCYQTILDEGAEELRGWEAVDLHEFFLGEHFGWEETEGFGRKRLKPIKRSSKLSTTEFMDFVESIQRFMAARGIYLPDPGESVDL